eukprot:scaffold100849_cov42-Phaeocystis_antarctica.AAC.1
MLQPCVIWAATPRDHLGARLRHSRPVAALHAATLCHLGCNPMSSGLQPYVRAFDIVDPWLLSGYLAPGAAGVARFAALTQ